MKSKKTINLILCAFFCVGTMLSQSKSYGKIPYTKAVNISGKQRMLSQKMAKSYLLLTKGISDDEIKRELNSSKFIFSKQLEILSANAETSAIKLYIKNVEKLWYKFKKLIDTPPSRKNSAQIMELNSRLLNTCDELVKNIEAKANYDSRFFDNDNKELVKIINMSGKQRMLSQRLCLYYTALSLFPDKKSEYVKELSDIFNEFDDVIGYLLINGYNTTSSEEELGAVMELWEKFQSDKNNFLTGKHELEDVFYSTNDLTTRFNKITGIYEVVAKNY